MPALSLGRAPLASILLCAGLLRLLDEVAAIAVLADADLDERQDRQRRQQNAQGRWIFQYRQLTSHFSVLGPYSRFQKREPLPPR